MLNHDETISHEDAYPLHIAGNASDARAANAKGVKLIPTPRTMISFDKMGLGRE
jgi:hypothetical protein